MQLLTIVLFILGIVLLILGARLLVRGASSLAVAIGISPLVVGLTVVAFGTSAPELAVGVQSAVIANVLGETAGVNVALGNVLGSNIANILLIIGLSAVVAPLIVHKQLLQFDLPIMIGISFLLLFMAADGTISQFDGLVLFLGIVAYTVWTVVQSRRKENEARKGVPDAPAHVAEKPAHTPKQIMLDVGRVVLGLVMLTFGSDWLVNGATTFARALGVSELIIGLTIVAVGTSLPEVATTVAATLRGHTDLAVGNAVGSNIFNILSVLGITSMVSFRGVPVPPEALQFDFPVMLAASIACLPVFFTRLLVSRWEGALFLLYYAAYITYLVLLSVSSSALPTFHTALVWGLVITFGWFAVDTVRTLINSSLRSTA